MDKWIEEILKNAGKYIKDHQTEIKVGAGATIATGLASSMFWSDHEQKAVTEAEKRGMVKASQMYEEKFHKLVNQIDELERKLSANVQGFFSSDQEMGELFDSVVNEYEQTIRKYLQMCQKELASLESKSNRTEEETEYMTILVNEYTTHALKLPEAQSASNIHYIIGRIESLAVDCIVNAANRTLMGGSGVDGAIHKAAGEELNKACKTLNGCNVGNAKMTRGYNLPAKYIIHTVGPIYSGKRQDAIDLANCYISSLELAKKNNIHTIAFPAISTGHYGYPAKAAADIALETITKWLDTNRNYVMSVIICCYDAKMYDVYKGNGNGNDNEPNLDKKSLAKFLEGLGFGVIHKYRAGIMNGKSGYLIWDYILINEISFVTSSNREVWALFKSVSDKETEEEFTRLSQMYCSLK